MGTVSTALSYRRGAWKSRSRTVWMPNPFNRFASVAPTPGSVETSSVSRRCDGVQPRGRGQSLWTRPVKPGCRRVIVATGTEHRTRPGQHDSLLVQEPEEPDRARAGVRADNGT